MSQGADPVPMDGSDDDVDLSDSQTRTAASSRAARPGETTLNINIQAPPASTVNLNVNVASGGQVASTNAVPSNSSAEEAPRERFELVRNLRKTIFGALYLGRDRKNNNQLVAVKLSDKLQMARIRTHENPRSECRLLRLVGAHPYVCRLVDEAEDDRWHWTILEFVDGGDFFGFVESKQGKGLGDELSRKYFRQLLSGIGHIHSRGLAHLDIKPENVLFTRSQDIKVCDFGMAREMKHAATWEAVLDRWTQTRGATANANANAGTAVPTDPRTNKEKSDTKSAARFFMGAVGTPMYMSPEVFAGEPFDALSADLYSCGVILYIMLTGAPPYELPAGSDPRFKYIFGGRMVDLLTHFKYIQNMHPLSVDLLQHLLCPANKRLTLEGALRHPWMRLDEPGFREQYEAALARGEKSTQAAQHALHVEEQKQASANNASIA